MALQLEKPDYKDQGVYLGRCVKGKDVSAALR